MFVCGCVICWIFDVFRAARKAAPASGLLLAIQDASCCMIGFFVFGKSVEVLNSGELRWYVFAGCILGALVYFLYVSEWLLRCMTFIFKKIISLFAAALAGIKKLCIFVISPIAKPVKWLSARFSAKKQLFRQFCLKNLSKKRENHE